MQKFCKLSLLQCTVARDITSHWTIKSFPLNCWDIGTADLPDPLRQEFFTHKFYSETTDEKKRGRIGMGTCINELESETCMKGNGDETIYNGSHEEVFGGSLGQSLSSSLFLKAV